MRARSTHGDRQVVIQLAQSISTRLACVVITAAGLGVASAADAASPPGLLEQLSGTAGCIANFANPVATCDNTGRGLVGAGSVTVSADGENAYVVSGSTDAVAVFDRDTTTGALAQKAGTAGCIVNEPSTDVFGCDNTGRALDGLRSVTVSGDGKSVYVASLGSDAVVVLDRDTATGALTQKAGAAGCIVNAASPVSTCDNTARALDSPGSVTVSGDGKSVYLAALGSNAVAVFDRDAATGALTQKAGAAGCTVDGPSADVAMCDNTGRALVFASSVTVSADGTSAYVAASTSDAVAVFDRDATTGALTQKALAAGCIVNGPSTDVTDCDNTGRALDRPGSLAVSADGKSAYMAALDSNAVAVFDRDPTGALTQKALAAGCIVDGPSADVAACDNSGRALLLANSVTVSADGKSAYATSQTSHAVAVFDRDTTTGALTQKALAAGCIVNGPSTDVPDCDNAGRALDGAFSVTVSPDGRSVYAFSLNSNAVSVFRRDLVPICAAAPTAVPHNQATLVGLSCTDPNGDAITLAVVGAPGTGTLGTINQGASALIYTPTAGFAGNDSLTYRGTAKGADSDTATAALEVLPGVAPVCAPDSQSVGQGVATRLGLSCAAGGDPFSYSIVTGPAHGGLGTITQSSGRVDYTPAGGFSGGDSFTFGATSVFGASSPATFALEVLPTQQGPTASKLVVALFQANLKAVSGKRVTLRYVSTLQADVVLDVLRGSKRIARVRGKARVGANAIRWNGRQKNKPAAPGLYKLRLKAVNGDQSVTKTASLKVTKPKR